MKPGIKPLNLQNSTRTNGNSNQGNIDMRKPTQNDMQLSMVQNTNQRRLKRSRSQEDYGEQDTNDKAHKDYSTLE